MQATVSGAHHAHVAALIFLVAGAGEQVRGDVVERAIRSDCDLVALEVGV
jgi:hypothetical protein